MSRRAEWLVVFSLLAVGALTIVTVGVIGVAAFAFANSAPAGDPEAEYYRGVYDVCIAQTQQTEACRDVTATFRQRGWFEKPSPGWAWPLPAAGSVS